MREQKEALSPYLKQNWLSMEYMTQGGVNSCRL